MGNFIVIMIILICVVAAISYMVKAKKQGKSCIGCPANGSCGKRSCDRNKG